MSRASNAILDLCTSMTDVHKTLNDNRTLASQTENTQKQVSHFETHIWPSTSTLSSSFTSWTPRVHWTHVLLWRSLQARTDEQHGQEGPSQASSLHIIPFYLSMHSFSPLNGMVFEISRSDWRFELIGSIPNLETCWNKIDTRSAHTRGIRIPMKAR